jgi:hypothetical protein
LRNAGRLTSSCIETNTTLGRGWGLGQGSILIARRSRYIWVGSDRSSDTCGQGARVGASESRAVEQKNSRPQEPLCLSTASDPPRFIFLYYHLFYFSPALLKKGRPKGGFFINSGGLF